MLPSKSASRHLCAAFLAVWPLLTASQAGKSFHAAAEPLYQSARKWEQERERAYNRQQFTKNFRDLQLLGQNLLTEHEARRLTSTRLAKDSKSINKCAKALRTLTALGSLAVPQKINKNIATPQEYDQSIRLLAKHIWDFAHNPVHQNSKVFNTDQARRAHTDLLVIIDLSKVIENKARGYSNTSNTTQ
jgi:hypothetical protein